MARKGVLPKGVKLQPFMANGFTPRCQFVRRVGEQCKKAAMVPRERCLSHGGRAGRPPVTGEFSKFAPVPRKLQSKFEKAAVDPELLNLTSKIALLEASIWSLCEDASKQDDFDDKQIRKLLTLLKSHKDLVAQETDRRISLGTMLDVQQVMQIISFVFASINRHVADPTTRNRIAADLRSITKSTSFLEEPIKKV
jgi:hypothetical protein